ncbi:hypothetical protein O988_06576 [Pseudogymnoascus sp. VKM F-3808]|nr:hypothetical protein O988_06576 [Pseudogymnoascus sp. VKM F-3808]
MAQELEIVLEGAAVGEKSNNSSEINNQLTEPLDEYQETRLSENAINAETMAQKSNNYSEINNQLTEPLGENELFTSSGPPPKGVSYRVEYCHEGSRHVIHSVETDRLDIEPIDADTNSDTGKIFDIVTTFSTPDRVFELNTDSGEPDKKSTPRVTDTRKVVKMHIYSPAIIHALRSIVKYYPGEDLLGEVIVIDEPFAILIHHEKELNDYKERCRPSEQTDPVCPKEKFAYHDINILQEFLEHAMMPAVRLERERNKEGLETFDMLWLQLKPGTTVKFCFNGDGGSWIAAVIEYVSRHDFGVWHIGYWSLDYEGTYLGQFKDHMEISRFEGEREAHYEQIIDDSAFEEPLHESVKDFVERGEKYYNLLSTKCQYYSGTTYEPPHRKINGLVMVDMHKYYADISSNKPDVSIWAFVFKTRTWEELHVSSLREPKFEQDMIDKLVMDTARIKILKALASSYIREDKHGVKSTLPPWSADFIQGKGQGQIILLHGKPGVGKTWTAECIAEYTKRPLMVLTSSDIGANPEMVENILSNRFKTASSWGAVLLIDEADVFMERRSSNDLNRNSLVAGFLRALEFYDGILFLTTNRVGSFDDAFISRIHVKLYYPGFTDEERQKVWQTFIDKLIRERGKTIRVSIDAKDFIKGKQVREVKWNGREIRNAFQTAVALAEYDAEKDDEGKILLKDTHLSSIVDLSKDFKKYLDDTLGADEDKRAAMEHIRHDRDRN